MKRYTINVLYLSVFFLACSFNICKAQVIPNASFEQWKDTGAGQDPIGWITANQYSPILVSATVFKNDTAHSGNYCMLVKNGRTFQGGSLNGVAYLKIPADAINFKTLRGWYKLFQPEDDSVSLIVGYTHRDKVRKVTDQQAFGAIGFANSNDWKAFAVSMESFNYHLPADTFNIYVFSSLKTEFNSLSTRLYIDDLSLTDTVYTSVNSGAGQSNSNLQVYPNPAVQGQGSVQLAWMSSNRGIAHITLTNAQGRIMRQENLSTGNSGLRQHGLDISDLPSGVYFLKINAGTDLLSTRIIIQ